MQRRLGSVLVAALCSTVVARCRAIEDLGAYRFDGTGGAGGGSSSATGGADGSTTSSCTTSASSGATSSSGTGGPNVCPGELVVVTAGTLVMVMGNTQGATQSFVGNSTLGNCPASGPAGPDLVYAVRPLAGGTLTVSFTATYDDSMVHVRTSCPGTVTDEVACQVAGASGMPSTLSLPVKKGVTYYVAAGTHDATSGPFTLTFSLM